MAISAVPTIKDQLATILAARGGLAGVDILRGDPGDTRGPESIWIGQAIVEQVAQALGNQRRNEDIELVLVIAVQKAGDSQETVTDRAYTILGEIEQALRGDALLSLTPTTAFAVVAQIAGWEDAEGFCQVGEGPGRFCDIKLRIGVFTRI